MWTVNINAAQSELNESDGRSTLVGPKKYISNSLSLCFLRNRITSIMCMLFLAMYTFVIVTLSLCGPA